MADIDSRFEVIEHFIPCQHIRGYPHAVRNLDAVPHLAIKQYVPVSPVNTAETGMTIIAAHANGLPKPLWQTLYAQLKGRIASIWFADCSHQGASGVLNESILGDDPNWFDHSRDLLYMVNHFRDLIKPPIMGVAHSMGCAQLVQLSLMHPRLFHSLVLVEPVIQETIPPGPNAAFMTSLRTDRWDSREEATSQILNNKFYKSWDRHVLDKYLEYGLRHTPTALYPNDPPEAVTLTTTKAQEAWSYVRSTFITRLPEDQLDNRERMVTADYTPAQARYLFHRAEAGLAFQSLPYLQPAVKWIFGKKSYINPPADREAKISRTGTAMRGSGGVSNTIIDGAGHLIPQERVSELANVLAHYIKEQLRKYAEEQIFWKNYDSGKSEDGMLTLSKQWIGNVRRKPDTLRPIDEKSKL